MRDGWRSAELREAATFHYGKPLREADRVVGDVPIVGSAGTFGWHNQANVRTDCSIVVGRKGTAGSVTWFSRPVWATDTSYWVEPKAGLDLPFLFLLLQNANLPSLTAQTGVPGLNRDRAYSMEVWIPPIEEQRRIVDLIRAVDDAIEAADTGVENSEALWWQLTSELQEQVSATQTTQFGAIAAISGGLTKNKKDFDRPDLIEVPYLRVANVHRRYLDLTDVATILTTPDRLDKLRLQPGDLLLNEGGDKDKLGRGAIWRGELQDCIHQNHVFRARITDENFIPEFVSAWANSFGQTWFETYGTQTTGIASISKTTLSRFPVPRLSRDDQQRWAELLESTVVCQDGYRSAADSLRSLRSEVLSALLSGAHTIPETYDELMGA